VKTISVTSDDGNPTVVLPAPSEPPSSPMRRSRESERLGSYAIKATPQVERPSGCHLDNRADSVSPAVTREQ
jgi:hypothetical protein